MTSPFHQIATQYAELWSETSRGRAQREQVWLEIDRLFKAGDRSSIWDAERVMSRALDVAGLEVFGIDAAEGMMRSRGGEASKRNHGDRRAAFVGRRIRRRHLQFGALNCVADLGELSKTLARLIRPQGKLALCVMSRFCWREDWRHLPQRWSGRARWRGIDIYYRSAWSFRAGICAAFPVPHRVSIGRGDHQLLVFTRRSGC